MVVYHEAARLRKLLLRNRTMPATQNIFLNLAGRRFRQLCDERHGVWRLEVSEMRARKYTQLIFGCLRAPSEHDERVRGFTPALMRKSHNRHLLYCRMSQQDAFDLYRRNVFAAANDHVL